MLKNQKSKIKKASTGRAVTAGTILAVLLSFAGVIAGGALLNNESITEETSHLFAIGIWVLASFAGALLAERRSDKSILSAILTSVVYYIVLSCIGILFFESNFRTALTGILAVVAGNIPVIITAMNKGQGKTAKKRYRFR